MHEQQIVYVVPCSGAKLDRPASAAQLYTGQMFRHTYDSATTSARLDAEVIGRPVRVLILSALHGLVEPDTVLAADQRQRRPGFADVLDASRVMPYRHTRNA